MSLHAAAERDAWIQSAACRDVAGDTFFPETEKQIAAAKAICRRCPVRRSCLEAALRNRERQGIWGGLTAHERRRLRRPPGEAA